MDAWLVQRKRKKDQINEPIYLVAISYFPIIINGGFSGQWPTSTVKSTRWRGHKAVAVSQRVLITAATATSSIYGNKQEGANLFSAVAAAL